MMSDDIQKIISGRPLTLHDLRALDDDPPAAVKDSVKRKISRTLTCYEKQVRTRQLEGVGKAAEQARGQQASIRQRLTEANKQTATITKAAKAGRVDPQQAEREIAQVIRAIQRDREALDQIDASIERIQAVADMDPADWQDTINSRFPATRNALPVITQDWLLGADDADPLGEK